MGLQTISSVAGYLVHMYGQTNVALTHASVYRRSMRHAQLDALWSWYIPAALWHRLAADR